MTPQQIARLVREWLTNNPHNIDPNRISDLVHWFGNTYAFTKSMEAETLGILAEWFPCVHELTRC